MDNQISVDVRRAFIETNLEACKKNIAMSLWQIGTLLCQAKDEGVVPHGEWTQWATAHSGLSERGVQHAMRQARELSADSPLLALDDSKINALLRIPAGEREDFARRIDAESASAREVSDAVTQYRREMDAQVKAARAERDEALRLLGEKKKRMQETVSNLTDIIQKDDKEKKRTAKLLDESREREEKLRIEAAELRAALEVEREKPASGPDPEQAQRIALLETQLKSRDQAIRDQEREIDRLSEALDEAQTAAMRGSMTGEGERTSPVTLILSAIGALMTQAGRAPAELARMQGIDEETRQLLAGQARMAGQWAMQVLSACGEGGAHV
ncbi:MAG: DUF3102 domain-containing protein [Aristaeellaceae bacterium]